LGVLDFWGGRPGFARKVGGSRKWGSPPKSGGQFGFRDFRSPENLRRGWESLKRLKSDMDTLFFVRPEIWHSVRHILPNCPPRFSRETDKSPDGPKLWQNRWKKAQKPALYGHVLPFSGKKGGFRAKDESWRPKQKYYIEIFKNFIIFFWFRVKYFRLYMFSFINYTPSVCSPAAWGGVELNLSKLLTRPNFFSQKFFRTPGKIFPRKRFGGVTKLWIFGKSW